MNAMSRWCLLVVMLFLVPRHCWAQNANQGGGQNNGGNNQNAGGIAIDTQGVLSLVEVDGTNQTLDAKRRLAVSRNRPAGDLNRRSKLRFVSLVALEREIDQRLARKEAIPDDLFYLAGLQRIDQLFAFPAEHDLVIAGPADGFLADPVGRMVGIESGHPTLRLDDLVVALRTVRTSRQLGCSIDPVPERIAELQKFIRQGGPATADEVVARFEQMDDILGLQNIRIDGVPPDSHFATAFVEADYRMKRIASGLENPQVKGLKSHLSMIGAKGNTMQRWWFVPAYDRVARSEDGLAYQLSGPRARLLTEEEVTDASGKRSSSSTINRSAQAFAKQFSDAFPRLAERAPVFGELQNLIDWTVVAALLLNEKLAERVEWDQSLFLDDTRMSYPKFDVPKQVPSHVSYKRSGAMVVGLVSGGVVLNPRDAYEHARTLAQGEELQAARKKATDANRPAAHPWWWDAE
ncbi:DUF1598 domain-containing protein [Schlesneria paludicola]|uniref:DUF1598 domain-containing protein n=1 Tax=Schlesneria paludicola TaxID=360056 RepID=UPI00029B1ADB|nr:DUF1598 domain-containing protein [Schlesneria paludicola]